MADDKALAEVETIMHHHRQPDKLAERVAAIRDRSSRILAAASPSPDLMRANEQAHAALEALLKAHAPITIYKGADWCGCEQPAEDDDAFGEWYDDHPYGADPGDTDAFRICHRSPLHDACPACSELAYRHRADENCWVSPDECVARPFFTRELLGEAKTDAACGPACWTPVNCPSCGNQLPPRGRLMPPEMGIMDCCDEARMNSALNPRHFWSKEEASGGD